MHTLDHPPYIYLHVHKVVSFLQFQAKALSKCPETGVNFWVPHTQPRCQQDTRFAAVRSAHIFFVLNINIHTLTQ